MMDVQHCELQDDEPEYSSEELKEMSQLEECQCEAWEQQKNKLSRFGFVAFLDLLGFSQIAARDDEAAIKSIFSIIKNCRESAARKLDVEEACDEAHFLGISSYYDDVAISFISDSIVLHQNLPDIALDTNNPDYKLDLCISACRFIRLVREIFSDLLRKKLPSRCAVAYGNYFWDSDTRSIMAGSALIEAHNWSESLAFPGIVCCESLMKELHGTLSEVAESPMMGRIALCDIDMPLKGCMRAKSLNGTLIMPNLSKQEIGDPVEFINRQFTSFGKPMPTGFSWDLRDDEKEVLYKRDKSVEVFKQLYG